MILVYDRFELLTTGSSGNQTGNLFLIAENHCCTWAVVIVVSYLPSRERETSGTALEIFLGSKGPIAYMAGVGNLSAKQYSNMFWSGVTSCINMEPLVDYHLSSNPVEPRAMPMYDVLE